MKLFLANSGKIQTLTCLFLKPCSCSPSKPFFRTRLISLPGSDRHLQLTSLATLHSNRVHWKWPMPGHI